MNILAIIGFGIVAAVLAVILRQYHPEYAMLVSLGAGVFILYQVLGDVVPVVRQVNDILESASLPMEYAAVLFKALGICFITQVACDACRDAGESAISAKIEMAGKASVLIVSLPLFTQVLQIVYSLIG